MQIIFNNIKHNNDMKKIRKKKKIVVSVFVCFFIGLINGFFGGGGGMLTVPLLENYYHQNVKTSHATAILVILPLCVVTLLTYIVNGNFNIENGYFVIGGCLVGSIIGALLLKNLKYQIIQLIFCILILFSGIKMCF